MKPFKLIMFCFLLAKLASPFVLAGDPLSEYDKKIISFIKKEGHSMDAPTYPEGHQYWKDLKWYRAQGRQVRPALIYLLEYDYAGDWPKMHDVMNGLTYISGDQSDLVTHIRKQLPKLINIKDETSLGYIQESIEILAKHGDVHDLSLMGKFQDVDDKIVKFKINQSIQKLSERLEQEKKRRLTPFQREEINENVTTRKEKNVRNSSETHPKEVAQSSNRWVYIFLMICFVCFGLWRIQYRR